MSSERILVTGAAGFIGFHLSKRLTDQGHEVIGLDNMNDYYDVSLKESRLEILRKSSNFSNHKINLQDKQALDDLFATSGFDYVVNLAARQVSDTHLLILMLTWKATLLDF